MAYHAGSSNDAQGHLYQGHTPQGSIESLSGPITLPPVRGYPNQSTDMTARSREQLYNQFPMPPPPPMKSKSRRKGLIAVILAVVVILAVAIGLIVHFCVLHPQRDGSAAASGNGTPAQQASRVVVGRNGDVVTKESGGTFTYTNKFGGYFIHDPVNPYNDGAKAQSYTPALNETWRWGDMRIMGVNLGGWLVPEPFIVPALYEPYMDDPDVNGDEWSLSAAMAKDTANGGLAQLENHYKTFITEEDFARIAGAGLNWIRLPIPFNAFGTIDGEPFLPHAAWNYTLKAFDWARKYGLRINLDLHTMPGSQNGLNHSGKKGYVAFASSVMGLANAQRGLDIIRSITEFISQPEYKNVVPMFSIINEPQGQDQQVMHAFYLEAYYLIRNITGVGEGNGPYIAIHDHFEPIAAWQNFLHGADRLILDTHPYLTFGGQDTQSITGFPPKPCSTWGTQINASMNTFGMTIAGEWSLGFNDCGQYIWGLKDKPHTSNCDAQWNDYTQWTPEIKATFLSLARSHMDALGNYFFWTWKTGVSKNSPQGGTLVGSPMWSYSLGLEQGWIPDDPRSALGECVRLNVIPQPDQYYKGTLESWQTGGVGAGQIAPTATVGIDLWPPAALATIAGLPVPMYTPTGPIPTLPLQTYAAPAKATADGWFNDNDHAGGMVPVAGCKYPDSWNPGDVPPPLCTGAPAPAAPQPPAVRRRSWQTPTPL